MPNTWKVFLNFNFHQALINHLKAAQMASKDAFSCTLILVLWTALWTINQHHLLILATLGLWACDNFLNIHLGPVCPAALVVLSTVVQFPFKKRDTSCGLPLHSRPCSGMLWSCAQTAFGWPWSLTAALQRAFPLCGFCHLSYFSCSCTFLSLFVDLEITLRLNA